METEDKDQSEMVINLVKLPLGLDVADAHVCGLGHGVWSKLR